jgi:hypothetical protein
MVIASIWGFGFIENFNHLKQVLFFETRCPIRLVFFTESRSGKGVHGEGFNATFLSG